jgi:hypothetical protein
MGAWDFQSSEVFDRRLKEHQKKHVDETRAVLNNLDTYQRAVRAGADPRKRHAGFMHMEPMGVVAVDQHGADRKLRETRLYFYPDADTQLIRLITIGDKNSQKADIGLCREFVGRLRRGG